MPRLRRRSARLRCGRCLRSRDRTRRPHAVTRGERPPRRGLTSKGSGGRRCRWQRRLWPPPPAPMPTRSRPRPAGRGRRRRCARAPPPSAAPSARSAGRASSEEVNHDSTLASTQLTWPPRVSEPMRIATLIAVVAAVCAVAAPAQAAPKRFFGVVYDREVSVSSSATQDAQFTGMRKNGVGTVRSVFSWAAIQPAADQPPNFTDTDALVARAARNDIEILPIVMYAPAWARLFPRKAASPPRSPRDYVAFLN